MEEVAQAKEAVRRLPGSNVTQTRTWNSEQEGGHREIQFRDILGAKTDWNEFTSYGKVGQSI